MKTLPADILVIGLGGNVGGDDAVLARMRRAREALVVWGRTRASSVYRTAAVGGPPQPEYLNAALAIHVAPPEPLPAEVINTVLELERLAGRDRACEERFGPRPLDLDVLVWGARVIEWPGPPLLEVPHPRLAARRFALAPLIELVGEDTVLPGDGRVLGALDEALTGQRVRRTELRID